MSNVFKTIIKSKPEIFIESDKHINKERERENKIKLKNYKSFYK
jgi:hypothetical protein